MHLKVHFSGENLKSLWNDTVTTSFTHSAQSNVPAFGFAGVSGVMTRSHRSWPTPRHWWNAGRQRRSWVEYRPPTSARWMGMATGKISELGSFSMSKWASLTGTIRLTADAVRLLFWFFVASFLLWSSGGTAEEGKMSVGYRTSDPNAYEWLWWRTDPFIQDRLAIQEAEQKGLFFGGVFTEEDGRQVENWWQELERESVNITAAPNTIVGGFT